MKIQNSTSSAEGRSLGSKANILSNKQRARGSALGNFWEKGTGFFLDMLLKRIENTFVALFEKCSLREEGPGEEEKRGKACPAVTTAAPLQLLPPSELRKVVLPAVECRRRVARERERETDSRGATHDRCRRSQARRHHHPRSCEEPLSCSCRCAPSSFPHPEPSICRHRYKGLSLEPRLSLSFRRRCRSSSCCRRFGVAAIGATSGGSLSSDSLCYCNCHYCCGNQRFCLAAAEGLPPSLELPRIIVEAAKIYGCWFQSCNHSSEVSSPVAGHFPGYMDYQVGMRPQIPVERKWALGIQTQFMLDQLADLQNRVEERGVPVEELLEANEVFCTGTAVVINPVFSVTYWDCDTDFCSLLFTALISWSRGASIGCHSDDNRPYLKQRHFAVVCYLNNYGKDFDGGLFRFQDGQPMSIMPMAGDVLMYTADQRNIHSVDEKKEKEKIKLPTEDFISSSTQDASSSGEYETLGSTAASASGLPAIMAAKSMEFSYQELAEATNNFNSDNKIGQGRFGAVYFAELRGQLKIVKMVVRHLANE
ncbi:hypothetical protein AHAS_Ahas16G0066200 [Arachis hypogaea]